MFGALEMTLEYVWSGAGHVAEVTEESGDLFWRQSTRQASDWFPYRRLLDHLDAARRQRPNQSRSFLLLLMRTPHHVLVVLLAINKKSFPALNNVKSRRHGFTPLAATLFLIKESLFIQVRWIMVHINTELD